MYDIGFQFNYDNFAGIYERQKKAAFWKKNPVKLKKKPNVFSTCKDKRKKERKLHNFRLD